MNKKELMNSVAATSGLHVKEASLVMNAAFQVISATLQQGTPIIIPGFGSFSVKERAARVCRNLHTGEKIAVAAKKVVKFKPGKGMEIITAAPKSRKKTK